MRDGDCFNLPVGDTVEFVTAVACTEPHDAEVYSLFRLAELSVAYPGDEAVLTAADDHCFEQFELFVGEPYDTSTLDFYYFHPTEQTWNELGDREVVCMVTAFDEAQLIGSMRGARV